MERKIKLSFLGGFLFLLFLLVVAILPLTQAILDWEGFYEQHQYPLKKYSIPGNPIPSKDNVITYLGIYIALAIVSSLGIIGLIILYRKLKKDLD